MSNTRTEHSLELYAELKEPYKTIYEIGVANGLRISDILKLKTKVLKVQKPTIREQKTGKSKRLYIPAKTRRKMDLMARNSPNQYIFFSTSSKTGHITRQAVYEHFKTAGKKAGIKVNIGTHTMRKNYAYKAFQKSHNIKKVQKKLNHSNTADTALYII